MDDECETPTGAGPRPKRARDAGRSRAKSLVLVLGIRPNFVRLIRGALRGIFCARGWL